MMVTRHPTSFNRIIGPESSTRRAMATATLPTVEPFFFEPAALQGLLEGNQESYQKAHPYPHIVFDNFLPTEVLEEILAEFPAPGAVRWNRFENGREVKLEASTERSMGPHPRLLLRELNSALFMNFLEGLTGIQGIIPDPHYQGGG